MSPFTNLGPGDAATWPPCYGHPGDPRTEEDPTDESSWTDLRTARCPFCGGEGQVCETNYGTFRVQCESCDAQGPLRTDPGEAVEAWDHRQPLGRHIPALVRRDRIAELQEQQ